MPQERSENFFTELLKFIVVAAVIVIPIRFFVAQPFIVSGESMHPTFENGQYLVVDELSYRFVPPAHGDVIIFKYPRDPREYFIKRIIGLPGETVTIASGDVSVTDASGHTTALQEPYIHGATSGNDATYKVGAGEYFVMGDNRTESSDSRSWGLLPRQNIVGRAIVRLFPISDIGIFPGNANSQ